MKSKFLFFDYDGTLSYNGCVSNEVKLALNKAKLLGHKIFINTGRCFYENPKIDDVTFDGLVLACGTHIIVNGKTILQNNLPIEEIEELSIIATKKDVAFKIEADTIAATIPSKTKPNVLNPFSDINEFKTLYNKAVISKLTLFSPYDNEITTNSNKHNLYCINHERYCEIVPNGYSKVSGMMKVLEFYGASPEDSIAFGDSMNDYDMIKSAGIGVAMGNSTNELKSIADFVTKNVAEDGVAFYINNILLK